MTTPDFKNNSPSTKSTTINSNNSNTTNLNLNKYNPNHPNPALNTLSTHTPAPIPSTPTSHTALTLNTQGLIPGPSETEAEFFDRANYCLSLCDRIQEELAQILPFTPEFERAPSVPATDTAAATATTTATVQEYDIQPNWVPLFYSNYQLPFWQGGCTWIFQITETSPRAALLQLRQSFKTNTNYLFGLYDRNEFLTHEMAHIGRMAFDEPQFEEILAYRSSKSRLRRWLGPIVQSSRESMLFVLVCLMVFIVDASLLSMAKYEVYQTIMWGKLLPIGLIVAALIRLSKKQRILSKTELQLRKILPSQKTVNAVLYRLSDNEIISFSQMTPQEIEFYVLQNQTNSLRWQLLNEAYFKKGPIL